MFIRSALCSAEDALDGWIYYLLMLFLPYTINMKCLGRYAVNMKPCLGTFMIFSLKAPKPYFYENCAQSDFILKCKKTIFKPDSWQVTSFLHFTDLTCH